MEFRLCARGRQWCGIIHYYWLLPEGFPFHQFIITFSSGKFDLLFIGFWSLFYGSLKSISRFHDLYFTALWSLFNDSLILNALVFDTYFHISILQFFISISRFTISIRRLPDLYFTVSWLLFYGSLVTILFSLILKFPGLWFLFHWFLNYRSVLWRFSEFKFTNPWSLFHYPIFNSPFPGSNWSFRDLIIENNLWNSYTNIVFKLMIPWPHR